MARTLIRGRPTGSSGSRTEPPMLSLTPFTVSFSTMSLVSRIHWRDGRIQPRGRRLRKRRLGIYRVDHFEHQNLRGELVVERHRQVRPDDERQVVRRVVAGLGVVPGRLAAMKVEDV